MKSALLIIVLLLVHVHTAYGVGNDVVDDITSLNRAGFSFKKSEYSTEGSVSFEIRIPPSFSFDVVGEKPFFGAAYIKPEDPSTSGPMLINAKGLRLPLDHVNDGVGYLLGISVLRAEAEGAYLEFSFYHGSGSSAMLIHVPINAVLDYLARPAKEEPTPYLNGRVDAD